MKNLSASFEELSKATLTDDQWREYEELGYLKLGRILGLDELAILSHRIDDIMLGKADLDYDKIMMQLDSDTGRYGDAGTQSRGFKGATKNYRKIQNLEFDPEFSAYMTLPIFRSACARQYGEGCPIASFRAMFMNKPARKGTWLPWHQDCWSRLDRNPLLTVWTALDPSTIANGCVQVIPRSHKLGLINPSHPSGFLTEEQVKKYCPEEKVVHLMLQAGEVVLLHNWLLHASDVNRTAISRRAFSVCYMDGKTQDLKTGEKFPMIF